jgi:hypothetical protein
MWILFFAVTLAIAIGATSTAVLMQSSDGRIHF